MKAVFARLAAGAKAIEDGVRRFLFSLITARKFPFFIYLSISVNLESKARFS